MESKDGNVTAGTEKGTWVIPSLANNASAELTVTATVSKNAKDGDRIINTAVVTGAKTSDNETLPSGSQPSAGADVTVK